VAGFQSRPSGLLTLEAAWQDFLLCKILVDDSHRATFARPLATSDERDSVDVPIVLRCIEP
jgi:hypothetical protein